MADTKPPAAPKRLRFKKLSLTKARLECRGPFDAVEYLWYRNNKLTAHTPGTVLDLVHIAGESGSWRVACRDAAGNISLKSNEVVAKAYGYLAPSSGDVTAPSVPMGLALSALSAQTATVTCSPSTDNVAVQFYQWFVQGVAGQATAGPSINLTGLTPNTAYSVTVAAVDTSGNSSAQSAPLLFTTPTVASPVFTDPGIQELTVSSAYALDLDTVWADADNAIVAFAFQDALPAGLTYNPTTRVIQGTPTTAIDAVQSINHTASDGANVTAAVLRFRVLNADTTAPNAAVITQATANGSTVNLAWTPGSDVVVANARTSGLSHHNVKRDGAFVASVPAGTNVYADSGRPDGTYSYVIRAVDAALNGTDSAAVNATVQQGTTLIRVPFGHFMRPGLGDLNNFDAGVNDALNKIQNFPNVKGIIFLRYWKFCETTEGIYNWSAHDQIATAAGNRGMYYAFRLQDRRFKTSGTAPAPEDAIPQYVVNAGLGYVRPFPSTNMAAGAQFWKQQCATYEINWGLAAIDRYGNDPFFMGIAAEESIYGNTNNWLTGNASYAYTATGYIAQEIRRAQAYREADPSRPTWLYMNGVTVLDTASGNQAIQDWLAAARADPGILLCGGPDLTNNNGWRAIDGTFGPGPDHRGDYLILGSTEQSDGTSPQPIYDEAVTGHRANIMSWSTNNGGWAGSIYTFIQQPQNQTIQTVPAQAVGRIQVL
jgi:chitodextrinase